LSPTTLVRGTRPTGRTWALLRSSCWGLWLPLLRCGRYLTTKSV